MISVLCPVLNRPQSAAPLLHSLREATKVEWELIFLCTPGDDQEIAACQELARSDERVSVHVVPWPAGPGDWARKQNLGLSLSRGQRLLLGADDLRFHSGWDLHALEMAERTNAGVIGTNDLGNPTVKAGKHSTHPLVSVSYIERCGTIDEPGKILHEGYAHQWCDTEFCETAMARGEWAFAPDSHVEHLHFLWGKSKPDDTYRKALSTSREDLALFRQRRRLWLGDLRKMQRQRRAPVVS